MTNPDGDSRQTRVLRTIAFVDLSGFTLYTEDRGDDDAVAVLAYFRSITRDVCARHGVRIAKWLGDGAMIVSVNAEDLAAAMAELRQRVAAGESPLPLRAGIATGPVILFEGDDYIGSIVNLAARLADLAEPGQLLAPKDFPSSLMVNTEAIALGPVPIRGFADPVEIVELVAT